MTKPSKSHSPELEELFERFRQAPGSHIFAPLADACRKAGLFAEALEVCKKGLAANPRYASGFVVQGKILYDSNDVERAESAFRRVLDIDSQNLVALKYLGIILAERGDASGARRCFQQILALDPEDKDIRRRLEHMGHDVVLATPAVVDLRAEVSADDDEEEEDVMELRAVEDEFEGRPIRLSDGSPTPDDIATMTLADIYAAQGFSEKALRIYREVLKRQPENDNVRQRIDALEGRDARKPNPVATPQGSAAGTVVPTDLLPEIERTHGEEIDRKQADGIERTQELTLPGFPSRPPAPPVGSKIDESRSYEQFKRWLRAMSD